MVDTLKIARCLETDVDNYITQLNDFTLLVATDTGNLYSKIDGAKVLLSGGTIVLDNKADKDLSNVLDFPTVQDGKILYKKDGKLADSGIEVTAEEINAPTKILNVKEIQVAPNTIKIGSNVSIQENGGYVENFTQTLQKYYIMLDYENDEVTGSVRPTYDERSPLERVIIQPDDTDDMVNVTSINFGSPDYDRQLQAFYFKLINPVNNLRMKFVVNGRDIAYHPSKLAWDGLEEGYSTLSGLQKFKLDPFFSNLTAYDLTVEFRADTPINMRGNGTLPYYELDINRITFKTLALLDDIPSGSEVDDVNFTKYFGVKATVLDPTQFVLGDFVKLYPDSERGFRASKLNPEDEYKGELIGFITVKEQFSLEVALIGNIRTGVNGLPAPTDAYIGFEALATNLSISNSQSTFIKPYGKCGEFGEEKDGQYVATFNAFQLISYYNSVKLTQEETDFLDITEPIVLPDNKDILFLTFDLTAGLSLLIQGLPDLTKNKGLQIYAEVVGPYESKVRLTGFDNQLIGNASSIDVSGGEKLIIFANENGWIVFYIADEFTTGIRLTGANASIDNIKKIFFPYANLTQAGDGTVTVGGYAQSSLQNVPATDFDTKLKASSAFQEVANRKPSETPDTIKEKFEANYYEETAPVNIAELEGEFIILNYQGTNLGIIQQELPPANAGKIIIMSFYRQPNTISSIEIFPPVGETINGESKTVVVDESKFIGLFIPTTEGGYEFISDEILNVNNVGVEYNNTKDVANLLKAGDGIKFGLDNKELTISNDPFNDGYMATVSEIKDYTIETDIAFDNDYYGDKIPALEGKGIVAVKIDLEGKATVDGEIAIAFVDINNEVIFLDETNRMSVLKKTKAGQDFGFIEYIALYDFPDRKNFNVQISDSTENVAITVTDKSAICIQPISDRNSTGIALLAYQNFTQQVIRYNAGVIKTLNDVKKLFGSNAVNYEDDTVTEIQPNIFMNCIGKTTIEGTRKNITIKNTTEIDIPKYSLNLFVPDKYVKYLLSKTMRVDIGAKATGAFNIATVVYTGTGTPSNKIVTDIVNGLPVFETGWFKIRDFDINSGEGYVDSFYRIGIDPSAKKVAVIVYSTSPEAPSSLEIGKLELSSDEAIPYYTLGSKDLLSEEEFRGSISYSQAHFGSISTVSGNANIPLTIDGKLSNRVTQSFIAGEGSKTLSLKANINYKIKTYDITVVPNESMQLNSYWEYNGVKIPASEYSTLVSQKTQFDMPEFNFTPTADGQLILVIQPFSGNGDLEVINGKLTITEIDYTIEALANVVYNLGGQIVFTPEAQAKEAYLEVDWQGNVGSVDVKSGL